jgi:predicted component of type VI protein secretion system
MNWSTSVPIWYNSMPLAHCEIYRENQNFYLKDLNSPEGTYILVNKSFDIHQNMKLEIGRSIYNLRL